MLKKFAIGIFGLIAVLVIAFVVWAIWIPQPMPEAIAALESDESIKVGTSPYLFFTPQTSNPTIGLILYPGARVDVRSYSPLARLIAENKVLVVLPSMPLNFAVFAPNRANDIQAAFPAITTWYIGGHSLGGAMAARFAGQNPEKVRGLNLFASFPESDSPLKGTEFPVISIYGTLDGLVTVDDIAASKNDLPESTMFVEIIGGNHAQFGWYGDQRRDNPATISREDQTKQTADAISNFIFSIESRP